MFKNFSFIITLTIILYNQCNQRNQLEMDLRFYCTLGLLEKVQECINNGARIDSKDGLDRTPLQIAKANNYTKIVGYLTSIGG